MLFELLNRAAGNQVQFKMIDLRLVYIVLFGSLYGINSRVAAAGMETLSLLSAYAEDVSWTTLFMNPRIGFHLFFILRSVQSADISE